MSTTLFILVSVLPLLLARGLIYAGRRRRIGTDPHCRRCNYLLHGIESGRCPECGGQLSSLAIVYGEPRRRWGLLIFGWIVLLLWGSIFGTDTVPRLQNIDWYSYKPTYFVLGDLGSNQLPVAERAWNELDRRETAGLLNAQSRDRLVRFALIVQGNAKQPYSNLDILTVNYLGKRFIAGDLPQDQAAKLFDQAIRLRLDVRAKVIAGDPIVCAAHHDGLGPSSGFFWTKLSTKAAAIDSKPVAGYMSGYCAFGGFGDGWSGSSLECRIPGKHTINQTIHLEIFRGPFNEPWSTPVYQNDRPLTGSFEVLATKPANLMQTIHDPKLDATVRAAIAPESFHFDARNGNTLSGNIHLKAIPVNMAFDVYARYGGMERPLGQMACAAQSGALSSDYVMSGNATPPVPAMVDVILRPSEKTARGTVDLYSYWKQELVYPNIPVTRP